MKEKLRALGRRWPWLGRALDVQDRVGEINGSFAASAITISVFIAIFPLLLVTIAVIGFLASGDADLPSRIIDNLGLTGNAAQTMEDAITTASDSRRTASVVGLLGLAWSGSGVAVALQQGVRAPWQERSEGIKDRLLGMAWLVVGAVGFAAAIALGGVLNFLPDEVPKVLVTLLAIAVGIAAEIGLFWWMFVGLGTRRVPARSLLPGAIAAGIGFEILKLVVGAVGFAAAIALGGVLNFLPDEVPKVLVTLLAIAVGIAAEIGLFWWMFVGLGTRRVPARSLLPGAIAAGIGFEILKLVGTVYVPQLVAKSSSLYGPLGIVFAILAWLAIFARLIVYCSTLNAVLFEASQGTVEVPLHVPRLPDRQPMGATRGGVILDASGDLEPAVPEPDRGSPAEDIAEMQDHDRTVAALRAESDKVRANTKLT